MQLVYKNLPSVVISSLKGDIHIQAVFSKERDKIDIPKLTAEGAIKLTAKGYIKEGKIVLKGSFMLGNLKQPFSWKTTIKP
jgi:hypothetical protein